MRVKIDKSFMRDVKKVTDKKVHNKIADCIESLMTVQTINEILNIRKLKVSDNYYRIRMDCHHHELCQKPRISGRKYRLGIDDFRLMIADLRKAIIFRIN